MLLVAKIPTPKISFTFSNSVASKKGALTMIYMKGKNNTGIYELKEYKEDEIPDNLKEKANVNYEDTYFKEQLNSYNNN